MLRRAVIAALVALAADTAFAAKPAEAPKEVGQYVDVSPVAIPILADGRLVNYVFVTMRVQLVGAANAAKWRAKEPYFRDALARIANRDSFASRSDYASVDGPRLAAAFQREAISIAGKDVKGVVLMAQTPKQRLGLPRRASSSGVAQPPIQP